jgi:hypothetical protein
LQVIQQKSLLLLVPHAPQVQFCEGSKCAAKHNKSAAELKVFEIVCRRNNTDTKQLYTRDERTTTMCPRNQCATFFASTILSLTFPIAARAASFTVNLIPSADAFVSSNSSSLNYGGAGALEVSGSASSDGAFESVLLFADSAAKSSFDAQFGAGNWIVTSISLKLTSATSNSSLFNAQSSGTLAATWMQNNTWTEGTGTPISPTTDGITAATLPSFLGPNDQSLGSFFFNSSTSGSAGLSATYPLIVSPGIMNDFATGGSSSIELAPADANVSYLVNSRSFPTNLFRPALSVTATAVPEPATLALALGGAALLGWRCKRAVRRRPSRYRQTSIVDLISP